MPTVGWLTVPLEEEEETAPELEAVALPLVEPLVELPLVEPPDELVVPEEEPGSGSSSRRLLTVQPTSEVTIRPAKTQRTIV